MDLGSAAERVRVHREVNRLLMNNQCDKCFCFILVCFVLFCFLIIIVVCTNRHISCKRLHSQNYCVGNVPVKVPVNYVKIYNYLLESSWSTWLLMVYNVSESKTQVQAFFYKLDIFWCWTAAFKVNHSLGCRSNVYDIQAKTLSHLSYDTKSCWTCWNYMMLLSIVETTFQVFHSSASIR